MGEGELGGNRRCGGEAFIKEKTGLLDGLLVSIVGQLGSPRRTIYTVLFVTYFKFPFILLIQ